MTAFIRLVYRRVPDLKLRLNRCRCGTLTPRRGGVCGPCLKAKSRVA